MTPAETDRGCGPPGSVAIIGAGPLGLMALKNLLEAGFDAVGFECRSYVGGLWKYSNDDGLSVTEKTTVFNSSRYRSAISDFPFAQDADDFPTAEQVLEYLQDYSRHFGLDQRIRLNSRIMSLHRSSGKWVLDILETYGSGLRRLETFDKVVVATGSFGAPKQPSIEGIAHFTGKILHAMDVQRNNFTRHKVMVVGMHATAQDVVVLLSKQATKVFISHRSGILMLPRYDETGATSDQSQTILSLLQKRFWDKLLPAVHDQKDDKKLEKLSRDLFPVPSEWGFFPAPSLAITGPLKADQLYPLLKEGCAEPVPEIRKVLGPRSVSLRDGRVLDDLDAIIFCTGYHMDIPFLGDYNPYSVAGAPPALYRNIFPLHPDHSIRGSLAFIGHAIIPFPGFIMHELVAMSIAQVWLGVSPLPSLPTMERWHQMRLNWRNSLLAKQKIKSTHYPGLLPEAEHIKWLDETAGTGIFAHFGWRSWFSLRACVFRLKHRELYGLCRTGLFTPAIWRLFDMGKRKPWECAVSQILEDNLMAQRRAIHKRQAEAMRCR